MLIASSLFLYAIIGMFIVHTTDEHFDWFEDTCLISGIFWPLILPALILIFINKLISRIVRREKFKKLLIFKDKYSTITVNTEISGRK